MSNSWAEATMAIAGVAISALQGYIVYMQDQMAKQQRENHLAMNSRLTQLLESSKGESHALGKAEGIAKEREDAKAAIRKAVERSADPPRTSAGIPPIQHWLGGEDK